MKRPDYISWKSYYYLEAVLSAYRSKDPNTRNGACIVDPETKSIVSSGYNGFPRGCDDDEFPWNNNQEDNKYPYVECAERNAIYNALNNGSIIKNCDLYLYSEKGFYPCCHCCRAIIQSRIRKVNLLISNKDSDGKWDSKYSEKMFKSSNITIHYESKESRELICKEIDIVINNLQKLSYMLKNERY